MNRTRDGTSALPQLLLAQTVPPPLLAVSMSHKAGDGQKLAYDETLLDVAPQVTKGQRQVTFPRRKRHSARSHIASIVM